MSTIEVGARYSSGASPGDDGDGDSEVLNVNVEEVCQLVWPLPQLAWSRVSDVCTRTVAPVYHAVRATLHDDVEELARLFVGLEVAADSEREAEVEFKCAERDVPARSKSWPGMESLDPPRSHSRSHSRPRASSLKPSDDDSPLVITNAADPSLPTIVITPCASRPRSESCTCLIPYQDAAFGQRLTVPTHPVLNGAFPPLVAPGPAGFVASWRYEAGHWCAQLPPVQEQMSKGMFSRPLSTRRQRAQMEAARGPVRARCFARGSHREG